MAVGWIGRGLAVAVVLVCGCSERRFVMTLESTDGTRASGHSRVHWSLWGSPSGGGDSIGTQLAEGSHAIDSFPEKLKLKIPRYPHERIGGDGIDKDIAMFWFSVWIDIDGDGELCGGVDMFEDWADFNDIFMHHEIPRRRTIPMGLLDEDHVCHSVDE